MAARPEVLVSLLKWCLSKKVFTGQVRLLTLVWAGFSCAVLIVYELWARL